MSESKAINLIYATLDTGESVDFYGCVLKLNNDGTVEPCDEGERWYAVSYKTSLDPFTQDRPAAQHVFLEAVPIAMIRQDIECYVRLSATNEAIVIGDEVDTVDDGRVDKFNQTAYNSTYIASNCEAVKDEHFAVVGIALEAKDALDGGYIKIMLEPVR